MSPAPSRRLRKAGHSPELVSAVVGQARLRVRARAKFGEFAERMLFTRAGLEQATRLAVAARHAGRFRDAGIGTRRRSRLRDRRRCAGLRRARPAGAGGRRRRGDRRDRRVQPGPVRRRGHRAAGLGPRRSDLSGVDAVWLDPARRTSGHSETARVRPEDYSPPLDWAFELAGAHPDRHQARAGAGPHDDPRRRRSAVGERRRVDRRARAVVGRARARRACAGRPS